MRCTCKRVPGFRLVSADVLTLHPKEEGGTTLLFAVRRVELEEDFSAVDAAVVGAQDARSRANAQ